MTPWYFYVIFLSSIFVVTLNLLKTEEEKTKEHNQGGAWHRVKCKCPYCEDVH